MDLNTMFPGCNNKPTEPRFDRYLPPRGAKGAVFVARAWYDLSLYCPTCDDDTNPDVAYFRRIGGAWGSQSQWNRIWRITWRCSVCDTPSHATTTTEVVLDVGKWCGPWIPCLEGQDPYDAEERAAVRRIAAQVVALGKARKEQARQAKQAEAQQIEQADCVVRGFGMTTLLRLLPWRSKHEPVLIVDHLEPAMIGEV